MGIREAGSFFWSLVLPKKKGISEQSILSSSYFFSFVVVCVMSFFSSPCTCSSAFIVCSTGGGVMTCFRRETNILKDKTICSLVKYTVYFVFAVLEVKINIV